MTSREARLSQIRATANLNKIYSFMEEVEEYFRSREPRDRAEELLWDLEQKFADLDWHLADGRPYPLQWATRRRE